MSTEPESKPLRNDSASLALLCAPVIHNQEPSLPICTPRFLAMLSNSPRSSNNFNVGSSPSSHISKFASCRAKASFNFSTPSLCPANRSAPSRSVNSAPSRSRSKSAGSSAKRCIMYSDTATFSSCKCFQSSKPRAILRRSLATAFSTTAHAPSSSSASLVRTSLRFISSLIASIAASVFSSRFAAISALSASLSTCPTRLSSTKRVNRASVASRNATSAMGNSQ
mmetsp:Transcript_9768/g.27240  ORF Transcript_9768/g.27240 Transcript_9768/m.27240 type:complete len:225 (+) Transcript_9768:825-1499(+)